MFLLVLPLGLGMIPPRGAILLQGHVDSWLGCLSKQESTFINDAVTNSRGEIHEAVEWAVGVAASVLQLEAGCRWQKLSYILPVRERFVKCDAYTA